MGQYHGIGGRGGKNLALARTAVAFSLAKRNPVAVTSELMKDRILQEAARLGVQIPEPVVIEFKHDKLDLGVTIDWTIEDYLF